MNPRKLTSSILLTIDVEDWFQVENFKQCIPFSSWPTFELRVEKNTHRILNLLDSIKLNSPTNSPKATFFVLGWIAQRLPYLVNEIQARGHEIASHGYYHKLCREERIEDLKKDLIHSKKLLEDITGGPIYGYRAPSFSINYEILRIIEECGYLYDSSFNSFGLNKRYGQVELDGDSRNSITCKISPTFYELPISNLRLGKYMLPWGGGGYFRLIPLSLFKYGVQSILKKNRGYLFYLHPWEIDPEQPVVKEAPILYKFRHYANLNKTVDKLSLLIEYFKECQFYTCYKYLKSNETNLPQPSLSDHEKSY